MLHINILMKDYQVANQPLRIEFEGIEDEYEELCAACKASGNDKHIIIEPSGRRLLNAREVLPQIGRIFVAVRNIMFMGPLGQDERMQRRIERFYDISKDVVPLCVIGNYSSGKSTFVNALVGQELLPSGDEPVTARVFQIRDSHDKGAGTIHFMCGGTPVVVTFTDTLAICEGPEPMRQHVKSAQGTGCDNLGPSLVSNMRAVLAALNAFKPTGATDAISDRIDVIAPFSGSDSWTRGHEFAIFDTPGSNSETHDDHAQVLREGMEDISNGLPLYVCEYSELDSKDNKASKDSKKENE